MAVEIKVPSLGESVTEVTVAKWLKTLGEMVKEGDPLVELETDKATQEIYAPQTGLLIAIAAPEGTSLAIGATLGKIGGGADVIQKMSTGEAPAGPIVPPIDASHYVGQPVMASEAEEEPEEESEPVVFEDSIQPVIQPVIADHELVQEEPVELPELSHSLPIDSDDSADDFNSEDFDREEPRQLPGVARMLAENQLAAADIRGSGRDGRLTKEDIQAHIERQNARHARLQAEEANVQKPVDSPVDLIEQEGEAERAESPHPPVIEPALEPVADPVVVTAPQVTAHRAEVQSGIERQKMSRLRLKISERLKLAQNTAAMLTTFNEVDMTAIMNLRRTINPAFEAQHGVKLGLMSLFVKAAIAALQDYPAVNAEIEGSDILYKKFYDIGVAVGTDRGLVVPVVRGAEHLSFAEIEKQIADMGSRAREGKLSLEEMSGGSFTITNGGVYGSLLSTPILNPPQSGILGMHKIQKRAVVISDESGDSIAIRQMMYLALTYDHRLIDGKEAVGFLVKVKTLLEEPQLLQVQI
ncbi:MAG: 2-oxoglutarate dehydrogenase complex dihydrolipoyllysine-residue succinyltransferase [Candidatus Pacebacteria bacterium]|nr:2-oxoglutarate dehydrogenase complex dihydrolipoyllysine-residue succinyltransferase [Candidatus Paceibacterota bacterium]